MFIITPEQAIRAAGDPTISAMRRDGNRFLLNNQALVMSTKACKEACDSIAEHAGISLTTETLQAILGLYPSARIKIAEADGCWDTDVNDSLMSTIAHFFMGCPWPTYGDKIDIDLFRKILIKQYKIFNDLN